MNRSVPFGAIVAALFCAATAVSSACVSSGNTPPPPGVDAALPFEDSGLLLEDGGLNLEDGEIGDGPLVIIDGTVFLKDGAVVLVPADAPSPDYTTDLSHVILENNVQGKVSTVSGAIELDLHTTGGDAYLALHGQNLSGSTFSQLDALWSTNATGAVSFDQDAGAVSVPTTSLASIGDTLPETSSILVMRRSGGVSTYQALAITFKAN
jgi:hypothetical protein